MMVATQLERHDFLLSQPNAVLINAEIRDGSLLPPRIRGQNKTMVHLSSIADQKKKGERHQPVRFMPIRRPAQNKDETVDPWLVIGRMADAHIMINDYTISKRHARIRQEQDSGIFNLEELGSTNGTWHNGKRIEADICTPLQSRDTLRFGRYIFTFLSARHFYDFLIELAEMK